MRVQSQPCDCWATTWPSILTSLYWTPSEPSLPVTPIVRVPPCQLPDHSDPLALEPGVVLSLTTTDALYMWICAFGLFNVWPTSEQPGAGFEQPTAMCRKLAPLSA